MFRHVLEHSMTRSKGGKKSKQKHRGKKVDTANSPSINLYKMETILGDQEDKSSLIIWEFFLIQISEFSYEKLKLKSEPQNYDRLKNATFSEVSNELCPSQY
jgi:hypothetical protein